MNHPEEAAAGFRDDFQRLHEEIAKVIVGAQPVIDGVQAELADLRIAAKDIGRRITQYEADGRNARIA